MCLSKIIDYSLELKDKFNIYKVFYVTSYSDGKIHIQSPHWAYFLNNGINSLDRNTPIETLNEEFYYSGFHGFLNKKDARAYQKEIEEDHSKEVCSIILKIRVNKEDIRVTGFEEDKKVVVCLKMYYPHWKFYLLKFYCKICRIPQWIKEEIYYIKKYKLHMIKEL